MRGLRIQEAVLYVKEILSQEILSQHIVLKQAAMSAVRGVSTPASSIFVRELWISVIRRSRRGFLTCTWTDIAGHLSELGVMGLCELPGGIQGPDRCDHYASKSSISARKPSLLTSGRKAVPSMNR